MHWGMGCWPGPAASGCTQLSTSALCVDLAQGDHPDGDGQQASHWKNRTVSNLEYVGIMDSGNNLGEFPIKNGKYLQDADVRAFDLMGYDIDLDSVIPGVQPVPSTTPANNATVPAGALTVSWGDAPFATSYDLYVDCPSCFVTYQQRDIAGTSHTIPQGILVNGPYAIVIAARNWRGFVSTPISVTVACPADLDDGSNTGTPDGGVTIEDLLEFLDHFEAGC